MGGAALDHPAGRVKAMVRLRPRRCAGPVARRRNHSAASIVRRQAPGFTAPTSSSRTAGRTPGQASRAACKQSAAATHVRATSGATVCGAQRTGRPDRRCKASDESRVPRSVRGAWAALISTRQAAVSTPVLRDHDRDEVAELLHELPADAPSASTGRRREAPWSSGSSRGGNSRSGLGRRSSPASRAVRVVGADSPAETRCTVAVDVATRNASETGEACAA
jgi:hypothetical protein